MRRLTVTGIDVVAVERAVVPGAYAKGARYAQQQAVLHMEWDDEEQSLSGLVRGSSRKVYHASVYFDLDSDGALHFNVGECSCPVEMDCEHAVAVALTAAGPPAAAGRAGAHPSRPTPSWERSLATLFELPGGGAGGASEGTPLAIELTLASTPTRPAPGFSASGGEPTTPRLLARVVRQGKTGWVGGGMSWSGLASLHHQGHRESHLRLLRELYALCRSARAQQSYYHGYHEEKTIDLAAFGSRQLWPMLDEADSIGLRLVHPRKALGDLDRPGRAELCLDITAGADLPAAALPGSSMVSPVLRVDGTDEARVPVGFIGAGGDAGGHGVVHVAAAAIGTDPASWRLGLARLATPVPPALQRMALAGERWEIPASEHDRFRDEFYPRLRHQARVVSSDDSFVPPAISDPTLLLHTSYGADHELNLSWEWAYQVGPAQLRAPLGPPASEQGYRDPAKERALLSGLVTPFERFGADLERGRVDLRGLDTMRFTTEVLPLLADSPGIQIETSGAAAEYREAGDSLRIGLSTDELAGQTDWFDLGVSITVEGRTVPFAPVFTALASGEEHLLLADGAYFSLLKPELQTLRRLIEEARALCDGPEGELRISRFQADLWDELTTLGVVDRQAAAWQRQVGGLLALGSAPAPEPPATLRAQLRPYQRDGFGWLTFLWESRLGGILADDMGLGKTLQTLALICHAKQAEPAGSSLAPFLILAPTSVVGNWASEAARFAPDLRVTAVQDTLRRRGQDLDEVIAGADVVVTSYTRFRLDTESYAAAEWSGLVLDEAQCAKNYQSKIYQCVRRLPAPFKLAITGTPMENNLMELWSLLSITAPGLFPNPAKFREHYAQPIEKQADAELLARFRRRIKPLVKRRTKELVAADLPAKQEQVLEVELSPKHRTIYQRHLQRERQKVLGLVGDLNRNRFTVLRSLTLLRQLSLHAGLVDEAHHDLPSAKIDTLLDQVQEVVRGGHRALVFSQFTGFLTRVRERLDEAGVAYTYLDGKTRRRDAVVAKFKDGAAPVFLISLKAGGFGLNLTEADYCFLLDPWWNPATEAQAVDRTHRIGQHRNVMVYRMIAKDTIEEKVRALQNRKAALFAGVMDDGNVFGSSLTADDIRELIA
ncbi:MAG: DEAD/DEAH box helicase [Pseudonocardia sp.]